MDGTHDVRCTVHFSGYKSIQRNISYHLIINEINMSLNEFYVNVAIDVANDILPIS